jgi:hypothetical protein
MEVNQQDNYLFFRCNAILLHLFFVILHLKFIEKGIISGEKRYSGIVAVVYCRCDFSLPSPYLVHFEPCGWLNRDSRSWFRASSSGITPEIWYVDHALGQSSFEEKGGIGRLFSKGKAPFM